MRMVQGRLLFGLVSFLILVAVAMTSHVYKTRIDPFASIEHFLDGTSGLNDPATFASMAIDYFRLGHIGEANRFAATLWPPGFVFLEAGILKLFGWDAPLPFILQILACALLAVTLACQRELFRLYVNERAAAILPFVIFVFPIARAFLLEPLGVVYGETYSVSLFVLACTLVVLAYQNGSTWMAIAAGVALGGAAYFRSQYELIVLAMTGCAIPVLLWAMMRALRSRQDAQRSEYRTVVKVVLGAIVAAHVVMLPWRLHNYTLGFGPTWVQTSQIVIKNSLTSERELRSIGGAFVISGGGHLACKFEPSYCGKSDKKLFYRAFFHHLGDWYKAKISLLPVFWSPYWNTSSADGFAIREMVADTIFVICLLLIVPLMVASRRAKGWLMVVWPAVSFYGAFFVIFSLVHFETRYFYLIKLFSFTLVVILCCMTVRVRRHPGEASFMDSGTR
ncbi:hypothetical protein [Bordetella bronchialis]|uniref:Glycosyltransferase RgtA/B/C/D-like domain-containing protein n=1 Tax=Bordetella bronchialis TaxID=463025 RepID=A0A193FMW9_9BORD|nr:hypothetical protein [Bordetella bronchialis]ANN69102.1 hypothetical protein BAU06_24840 [Bordetella bronchialis]ANN74250.1 hypothetical protein BAU08_25415 [Bordetella bronchialis]